MSKNYYVEPVIIKNSEIEPPSTANGMWENRHIAYFMYKQPGVPECSIVVTGYNRLNKTQYCVECVLKYTIDVDFELILVDNGSTDETYDYFQSVPYDKKKIIKVEKNLGASFPFQFIKNIFSGKYLVFLPNDVYVTKSWLSNLLRCMKSDPKIGMAMPCSSNVSNLQEVYLEYSDFNEMQEKAAVFNQSSPMKWEERMRLISIINLFSREVMDTVGILDPAFVHDFMEDDYSVRMRRAGYKLMLCKDTFICHDHDFRNLENKTSEAFNQSLESGRAIYLEKYHGIDAWNDINNFEFNLLSLFENAEMKSNDIKALTVDVKCGTPVLEIRNRLKQENITGVKSYAFTTDAKYYTDLQTVAHDTQCDRIEYIREHYAPGSFDLVLLGNPINTYVSPTSVLCSLMELLTHEGILLFKLHNINDVKALLNNIGMDEKREFNHIVNISVNEMNNMLVKLDCADMRLGCEKNAYSQADLKIIEDMLIRIKGNCSTDDVNRLTIRDYLYYIKKK